MLAHGNGDPRVCAMNLLKTVRGTVPYVRFKGIGTDVIDRPISERFQAQAEAQEVIQQYEPRVRPTDAQVVPIDPKNGGMGLKVTIMGGADG